LFFLILKEMGLSSVNNFAIFMLNVTILYIHYCVWKSVSEISSLEFRVDRNLEGLIVVCKFFNRTDNNCSSTSKGFKNLKNSRKIYEDNNNIKKFPKIFRILLTLPSLEAFVTSLMLKRLSVTLNSFHSLVIS